MTREEAINVITNADLSKVEDRVIKAIFYLCTNKALEQEPKTGHWIRGKERHFLDTRTNLNVEMKEATGKGYHTYINAQCSKCRMITIHDDSILYQYCPHCGAKMVEPQERSGKE